MNLSFLSSASSLPTVEPETFTMQPEAFETGIGKLQEELQSSQENLSAVLINTLSSISKAKDFAHAIKLTLDSVKQEFGWAYGSYWSVDKKINALTFTTESGTVTPRIRQGNGIG